MKALLVAFLAFLNLLGLAAFVTALFVVVIGAQKSDVQVTLALSLLGVGVLPPALTAAVLFKTQIISAGNTWKEIIDDVKPLLPWGAK